MTDDAALMHMIHDQYGERIAQTCAITGAVPAFVAALIANESGGNPNARRFEKNVLAALWEVLLGRKAAYGSIGRADLVAYVANLPDAAPAIAPRSLPADALQRVDSLATSIGLTQVMGWHVLESGSRLEAATDLLLPGRAIAETGRLLLDFARQWTLNIASDFENLLRCWNTGNPDGATFDPEYVPKGMLRMNLYDELPEATP